QVDLRQAFTAAERRGLPGNYVSYAVQEAFADMRYRGAVAPALASVDAALKRHPLGTMPAPDRPYLILAAFYAEAGQPARGRALLAEYEQAIPEGVRRGQAGRHGTEGLIAYAEGRLPDAVAGFRAWYDEGGQLDRARDYYGRFVDLWKNADPDLQPFVRDVRGRIARLTMEGTR